MTASQWWTVGGMALEAVALVLAVLELTAARQRLLNDTTRDVTLHPNDAEQRMQPSADLVTQRVLQAELLHLERRLMGTVQGGQTALTRDAQQIRQLLHELTKPEWKAKATVLLLVLGLVLQGVGTVIA